MAAAQALYDKASAEMDVKNYASACPTLEEVTRLIPEGLGAKLTLAECYEGLGKLASAWSAYTLVEELAKKAGQDERARKAARKAAALLPGLATLTIQVPEEVRAIPGLAITHRQTPVGEAQWGTPLPVDAGEHEVEITAPGRKRATQRVTVAADGARVALVVKPLEAEASPAPPAARAAVPPAPVPLTKAADAAPPRPWQRPVGLVATTVGALGVGASAVLGGLALSRNGQSNADNHCFPNNRCDATGLKLRDEARAFSSASIAALIAGGVVLGGGVVVLLTAPRAAKKPEARRMGRTGWSAAIGLTPGGVQVKGVW